MRVGPSQSLGVRGRSMMLGAGRAKDPPFRVQPFWLTQGEGELQRFARQSAAVPVRPPRFTIGVYRTSPTVQRTNRRLRACPSLVLNCTASASDTRRLVWLSRGRSAFFGMGNQGGEARVAVQCREIRIVFQMESNIRSQPVVDCVAQK